MHLLIRFRKPIALSIIIPLLACIGFTQTLRAVIPAPDGGYGPPAYGIGNTAEGEDALLNLSSGGSFNTATGYRTLLNNTTGNFNTAIGAGALFNNTADQNTAMARGRFLTIPRALSTPPSARRRFFTIPPAASTQGSVTVRCRATPPAFSNCQRC